MKRLLVISIVVIVLSACGGPRQIYNQKPGGTQTQFNVDSQYCAQQAGISGEGGFIFGPLWFVAPVVAAYGAYEHSKSKDYQKCMESLGYKCIKNCAYGEHIIKHEFGPEDQNP